MAVPYTLALPEIVTGSSSFPVVEVTGLSSLPIAAAVGLGAWGYNRYNKNLERLTELARYSNRNADRLIRNIGLSHASRTGPVPTSFIEGHVGSKSNPIKLKDIDVFPSTYNILGSRFYATADSTNTPTSQSTESSGSEVASPSSPEPERNDSTNRRRPSLREKIGDRIAGRNTGGRSTSGGGTTPPDNQQGSFLGRMLWETKNNNFGLNWWQWRNVGRVGLGASYPAREHLWPAVGLGLRYMTIGPDSVPATVAPPQTPATTSVAPIDSGYLAPLQIIAPTDTLDF